MKRMRKLMALVIAVAMVLAMGVSVFAAGDGTITITDAVDGHTYTAYQIFKGDLSDGVLSNIDWGNGINDAGKAALRSAYSLEDNASAAKVAEAIGTGDSAAVAFADHVGSNVTGGTAGSLSGTTYTISGLEDGYYMVVDTYTPQQDEEGVTYSRYMVQVVGEATVKNKAVKPEVEKKIVEGSKKVEGNTANIGDDVSYEITSTVPDMTGYKEYYMDFSDTLSKGLTYNNDLKVYIGETQLAADAYTLTVGDYDATNGTSISIHLKDLVSRNAAQNAQIKITYTAKVNDNAVIGNTGNPNTVKLDYSNNPADSGNGTPDDGNDGVQGETPKETVKTFVTEIELTKVDGDNQAPLAGAVFNVKGSQINKVILTGDHFVEAADGTFYLLKDGTYTTKAPTEQTADKYESTETKYKKEAYTTTSVQETANVEFQVVTGEDGKLKVTGLKEGTYTFTEIQAPDGYNLLDAPITVVIGSNADGLEDLNAFKWTKETGSSDNVTVDTNGTFKFTVENNKGSELPTTGGIGTTIFYIVGAILVVGGGILLVSRRRMSSN